MTNLNFFFFFQGARGLDGEPGPQGIPGAPVSFLFTKPNDRVFFFFLAMINNRFFAICMCVCKHLLHLSN